VRGTDAVLRHTDLMAPAFQERGIRQVEMAPGEAPTPRQVGIHVLRERRSDPRVAALIELVRERSARIFKPARTVRARNS